MCKAIPKEEWSGVLFYEIEGTITEPQNFKMNLKDILPLDKGSGSFTSYDLDNRYVEYLMDNPEAMDWKTGHIHSHNVMSVFFSGTDNDELKENSSSHNFYLSLIVNNYMDFTARVAFRGKSKVYTKITEEAVVSLNEQGESYTLTPSCTEDNTEEIEKVFYYNCDILSSVKDINVPETFSNKVKGIIDTAAKKKTPITYYPRQHNNLNSKNIPITSQYFEDESQVEFFQNPIQNSLIPNTEELEEIEAMVIAIIKGGIPPIKGENLEFIITQACIGNDTISGGELKDRFSTYLVSMYEKYITNADKSDIERFEFIIEEVIDILVEYQTPYPFLTQSVTFLKSLVNQLNTYATDN